MCIAPMTVNDQLSPEQQQRVDALKAAVAGDIKDSIPLQVFCSQHTYVRYLRARQWNLANATKMLKDTIAWRKEVKPERIMFNDIESEAASGKLFILDWVDNDGNVIVCMVPRNQNSKDEKLQMQYLVYILERASQRADTSGTGKMTWLIDFVGYGLKNAPPLSVSKMTMQIVQNHYPERLSCAVCWHAPKIFEVTWKAVQPFIDPVTRKKVMFIRRKKKNGLLHRVTSNDSAEGFQSEDGDVTQADDEKVAAKFDMQKLHSDFGGRNQVGFRAAVFAETMMIEDSQRDLELAKLM